MMQRSHLCMLSLLLLISLGIGAVRAQSRSFPVPFGPANTGRDFWVAFPANWDQPAAAKYYIRLYITSAAKTQVRVWAGKSIRKIITTKPYDIVTVDLAPVEAQIFTRTDNDPVPDDKIYKKKAVHIEADAPIAVYGMNRTSYTSDGMLLLPTNGLGRQYIVSSYGSVVGGAQELPSQFMVIAPYNNTQVTVKQPMASPNHPEGSTVSFTLDSGDVYSAMSVGYGGDMTGARISASKPVAVTAGQNCAYIPNQLEFCCCDHIEEQMLPVESWGKVYHGVPFATRKNGDIWRIFASQPDTRIKLNGLPFATLTQAGGKRGEGWTEYRANGQEMIEWTADKPIYVAQYNASQYYDNVVSDPFYLVLTPLEQYQTGLTFSTPSNDFPRNFINIVADSATFQGIEIASGPTGAWGKLIEYPGAGSLKAFASKINGRRYIGMAIDIRPGTYRMRGSGPFAGYVYGFGEFDSYGYPLSAAVANHSTNDNAAPEVTSRQQSSSIASSVVVTDIPGDPSIRTNISTIEIDPDSSYNYHLAVDRFEPGVSPVAGYTLTVADKSKAARAIVYISDGAGNVTADTVQYLPFDVELAPSPLEYGSMAVGEERTRKVTIRNTGGNVVAVQQVVLQKGNVGFTLLSPGSGFILGPSGSDSSSIEADVKFAATSEGMFQDSLGVRIGSTTTYLGLVSAQVGSAMISVSDWDFGRVQVGAYTERMITVINTAGAGGSSLTVSGASGPSDAVFTLPDGLPAFPFTLAPQASRTLIVRFTPTAVQSYSDRIIFQSNASSGDNIALLNGEGGQSSVFATSLIWGVQDVGTGPYPGTVYIKNPSGQAVTVNGVAGTPLGDTTDFRITNLNQLQGKVLAPGDSVIVDVEFWPTAAGHRVVIITWDVSPQQAEPPRSELTGSGLDPRSGVSDEGASAPQVVLDQNQPNPVTTTTTIGYSIAAGGETTLRLYDAKGSVVRTLVDGHRSAGRHEVKLDVSGLASGSYYYTLTHGEMTQTRTLTIVR